MKPYEVVLNESYTGKGQCWEIKKPIGHVIIFEGMQEYVARYDKFALYLNDLGYNVYGIDTFGQGENVKDDMSKLGVWPEDSFNKQLKINSILVSKLKETGKPVHLFCHSMGSFMGQGFLEQYPELVDKIVLCGSGAKSPALIPGLLMAKAIVHKSNAQKPSKFLANLMFGNFNKRIEKPETQYDWLSVNKDNVDAYIADPLCGGVVRNQFCLEFIKFMVDLYKEENLNKINKNASIFLISGSDDPVTSYGQCIETLTEMYHQQGVQNVSGKIYRNKRHEILNEDDWQVVAKDVADFFGK